MKSLFVSLALLLTLLGTTSSVEAKPSDLPVDPAIACPDGTEGEYALLLGYDILLKRPYFSFQRRKDVAESSYPQFGIGGILGVFLEAVASAPTSRVEGVRWPYRTRTERPATEEGGTEEQETPMASVRRDHSGIERRTR